MANVNEKSFIASLTAAVSDRDPLPNEAEVGQLARTLAPILGFDGSVDNAVQQALISVVTRMGQGVSIVDNLTLHDEEWVRKRQINWTYNDAYETFLRQGGWSGQMVQSLSDVSVRILGHLQDPIDEGAWDRRGLVIGHVQSGKTANYLGLVCRAADVGYKFIIIIAGIHNNLRKQTQERVDAGFVGRSSDPNGKRELIGVGRLSDGFPHPATLTNTQRDFTAATAKSSGWQINDFSKPIVVVIKKNVSTIKALHRWLFDLNAKNGQIRDVPMLMIDDEADNASINTNKEELDPTKTNAWIRQILSLFAKSCYVGYTATPFANIFINPDAYDDVVRDELFPRDFIYSLDAPTTYFGPETVFLNEATSDRVLEPILDVHRFTEDEPLPESLLGAIDVFLVARAIRLIRGQKHMHCSMLVNVSARIDVQRAIKTEISRYSKLVREAVLANYAVLEAETNYHMGRLRSAFETQYIDSKTSWDDVKSFLPAVLQDLRLYVINSKSDEVLDYARYELDGEGLTAIAIGGLSLSRGLTLEGLTVSYMHRTTSMYDTLMQMGRWFGYRPGYEDLCRVYLPPQSIEWYQYIGERTEELRDQIRRMRREGRTPRDFGLYVERHPDRLLITAANKMRHGEKVELSISLGGRLVETHIVPRNSAVNHANEELIREYWSSGFGGKVEQTEKGWWVKDAPLKEIITFLSRFRPYTGAMGIELGSAINYLHELDPWYDKGDVLLISVAGEGESSKEHQLGVQRRSPSTRNKDADAWEMSKQRVASRGDEKLGLTNEQRQLALQFATRDNAEDPLKNDKPSDKHYREARNKPLLMIHVLGIANGDAVERVPAIGISFPYGDHSKTVKVVVNKVWLKQMMGAGTDDADEDDDYDE